MLECHSPKSSHPLPPSESKSRLYTSVSLSLSCIQGRHCHLPKFHIYVLVYCIGYQFCTFKNPIFSTHFYLGARLLAGLLSPSLDSPFSPSGSLYLLPSPSLLYPTLWVSLCVPGCGEHLGNWLLAGSVSLLFIPPLLSSWPPLSPFSLFSSLYNSVNVSEWSRLWSTHKEVITG